MDLTQSSDNSRARATAAAVAITQTVKRGSFIMPASTAATARLSEESCLRRSCDLALREQFQHSLILAPSKQPLKNSQSKKVEPRLSSTVRSSRYNRGMSNEHAKTVDPRPFNWGTPEKITAFFFSDL